ncbi:hypothetical protein [Mesorhizobium sp. ESP-6-2]|uniref:hypothetical protein n=1 Tax=Mesorhizobium sp. ESP-6-2 TaxID=2876625 RepID=UPI001CCB53EE|nr:hypothetical protein [Mesorhizobium sp. ESP-6-2]MBZ9807678.1 hypothetical protein [Mesorhizobium sp. ESP-6-2]
MAFPPDIRKKAEACLTPNQWNPDTVSAIAHALMDERERCATIAETINARKVYFDDRRFYAVGVGEDIAAEIRSPSSPKE